MNTLSGYRNRYAGHRFIIVGKGPTDFQFENLADVGDPIIFINDAVQFDRFAERSLETFLFALDARQAVWVEPDMRSTPILSMEPDQQYRREHPDLIRDRLFLDRLDPSRLPDRTVGYRWGRCEDLTAFDPADIDSGRLLVGHKGTIIPAIHFARICGAAEIAFIGCDGVATGYDARIDIQSLAPDLGLHAVIRRNQDALCKALHLPTTYVHTEFMTQVIPRRMNLAWFGGLPPGWVVDTIRAFREHHPEWHIRLHNRLPTDLLADPAFGAAAKRCWQQCQLADLLYLWVLYHEGGFVMDTDSVAVRAFDELRRGSAAFSAPHLGIPGSRLTNGLMGAVPRSRAFERCINAVHDMAAGGWPADAQGRLPRCTFGPTLLTKLFSEDGDRDFTSLPWWYFYPFPTAQRDLAAEFQHATEPRRRELLNQARCPLPADARPFAVHLWGVDGSGHAKIGESSEAAG